jgi:hypothetical protein
VEHLLITTRSAINALRTPITHNDLDPDRALDPLESALGGLRGEIRFDGAGDLASGGSR